MTNGQPSMGKAVYDHSMKKITLGIAVLAFNVVSTVADWEIAGLKASKAGNLEPPAGIEPATC